MSSISDEKLVKQINQGGKKAEKAFTELVNKYSERLYWHIRKIVLSHENADDVLQNTFIKIFENLQSFRSDSKLYTWMYRIATNEALSFLQKQKRNQTESIEDFSEAIAGQLENDPMFSGDAIQLHLQKAIATLPEKQRVVFNMKYFDDIKYKDMAEILDTSVGALKASYHHAVNKIEEYMQQISISD